MSATATTETMTLAYHELRAPLGLMATAAAAVAEASPDAAAREQCEVILRAAERLLRTTGRVLALARPAPADARERAYAPAPLVERIASDLGNLQVAIEFSAGERASDAFVWGHQEDLETLVSSLLMNAIDHGDPDEIIGVSVEDDGASVHICISNRAASEQRHRGLALGTQLCEELARRLGATLRSESDGGRFSAQIELPRAAARAA